MHLPGTAFLPFSIDSGPKHAQHERSTSLSLPCSFQRWIHAFLSFLARTWHLRLCFVSTIACDRDACDRLCASKQSTSLRRRSFCAGSNCHRGFCFTHTSGFSFGRVGRTGVSFLLKGGFDGVEPGGGGERRPGDVPVRVRRREGEGREGILDGEGDQS